MGNINCLSNFFEFESKNDLIWKLEIINQLLRLELEDYQEQIVRLGIPKEFIQNYNFDLNFTQNYNSSKLKTLKPINIYKSNPLLTIKINCLNDKTLLIKKCNDFIDSVSFNILQQILQTNVKLNNKNNHYDLIDNFEDTITQTSEIVALADLKEMNLKHDENKIKHDLILPKCPNTPLYSHEVVKKKSVKLIS
jgi:hypothetical protein